MANKSSSEILQGVIEVPLSDIIADERFNARKDYGGDGKGKGKKSLDEEGRSSLDELAASLKRDGQLQPALASKIEGKVGKYFLRFGFRRFKALQAIGAETIKIQLWEGEEKDAILINLAENCARDDLKPWELADRCATISKEFDMSGTEIGQRIGKSKGHVNNMIRIWTSLDKKVLDLWIKGDGRCVWENLLKMSGMEKKEQAAYWESLSGEKPEGGKDGKVNGDPQPKGSKRPSKTALAAALKAVKYAEQSDEYKAGCSAALKYVLGKTKSIPNVFPVKEEE
jgi:ParB/RepB/Spo0J family partition protein